MHSLEPLSFGPEESNFGIVYGVLILDSAPPQPLRFVRIPRGFFHLNYLPYEYQNRIYKSLRLQDRLKTSVVKKYGVKTSNKKPVIKNVFFKIHY